MTHHNGQRIRMTAVARIAWGVVLVLMPERLLRVGAGRPVPASAVTAVRVLGLRHLLQAGVTVALPTGPVAGLGVLVDAAHASSCVALAVGSRRWRRAALIDLAVETALAASGWAAGRRSGLIRPPETRRGV